MSKIIVALDGLTADRALALAEQLKGHVWGFKVNDLLVQCGAIIVTALKKHGKVFADPKLYDIPNTVTNSVGVLREAGADLITVHASGGHSMMQAAVSQAGDAKILAVTLLTSYPEDEARRVYGMQPTQAVHSLAQMAADAGVHGIVCAATDLAGMPPRDYPVWPPNFLFVVPAFRPTPIENDDQKRIGGFETVRNADLIVVGRPIVQSEDPLAAVILINDGLARVEQGIAQGVAEIVR